MTRKEAINWTQSRPEKCSVQTLAHTHAHLMSDACGSHCVFKILLSLIRTVLVPLVYVCLLSCFHSCILSLSLSLSSRLVVSLLVLFSACCSQVVKVLHVHLLCSCLEHLWMGQANSPLTRITTGTVDCALLLFTLLSTACVPIAGGTKLSPLARTAGHGNSFGASTFLRTVSSACTSSNHNLRQTQVAVLSLEAKLQCVIVATHVFRPADATRTESRLHAHAHTQT